MEHYPLEKYKFIINEEKRQIIAMTRDAGKIIKATATCAPEDKFDIEYGKKLAASRVNYKVAVRRVKRAIQATEKAREIAALAEAYLNDATDFLNDSHVKLKDAVQELYDFHN